MLYYHLHYVSFLKITVTVMIKVAGRFLLGSGALNLAIVFFFELEIFQAFVLGKSNS